MPATRTMFVASLAAAVWGCAGSRIPLPFGEARPVADAAQPSSWSSRANPPGACCPSGSRASAAPRRQDPAAPPLPPVPPARGPLAIRVVYPALTDRVTVEDSSFLYGSVGDGRATLTIDGRPVPVLPNGAFLAWVRYPDDNPARFTLRARRGGDSVVARISVRRTPRFRPPAGPRPWIDTTSFRPAGAVWWPRDESLSLSVRAAPGARVALVLPDGRRIPFSPDGNADPVPVAIRAFDRDPANLVRPRTGVRHHGVVRNLVIGPRRAVLPPDPTVSAGADPTAVAPGRLTIEAVAGGDTARAAWPLTITLLDTLPIGARLDDASDPGGRPDGLTAGRASPGATYHWFFPAGTLAEVSGRLNEQIRLRLSATTDAWVPAGDAQPVAGGLVSGLATVGALTITPAPDRDVIRIPLTRRVPFRVIETERGLTLTLYGAAGDIEWIRYGTADDRLALVRWAQQARGELALMVDLARPLWGYRLRWEREDLLLELRHPPPLDPVAPLTGRLIVVDPGHPPGGSTGPTGLTEAEANLGISLALAKRLEASGARVLLTRTGPEALDLVPRIRLADSVDADLLVSIHNNALPDGVNPFTNAGSSVFYFHPRSLGLARAVQAGLARELPTKALGVARGDLALVRPTWMPAVLVEGLFIMVPEHESALRDERVRDRYARAVATGIERFLQHHAGARP